MEQVEAVAACGLLLFGAEVSLEVGPGWRASRAPAVTVPWLCSTVSPGDVQPQQATESSRWEPSLLQSAWPWVFLSSEISTCDLQEVKLVLKCELPRALNFAFRCWMVKEWEEIPNITLIQAAILECLTSACVLQHGQAPGRRAQGVTRSLALSEGSEGANNSS